MYYVLIAVISLVALCILIYSYYGGFKKLEIKVSEKGGETVAYESILGDYRQSGVVMDKIYYSLLNNENIETYKGYGKYFDNPKRVEKDKLRSEAGCIIETKDLGKIDKLESKFKIQELPVEDYITTEFPYKGKASVFVSIMKVYPALSNYAEKKGYDIDGAVIEIYDIPNKKILYRKELKKK